MPAPTPNMGELLIPLWRGSFTCSPTASVRNWAWTGLKDNDIWQAHRVAVGGCTLYIPISYDRLPCNVAKKYHYGLVPALL